MVFGLPELVVRGLSGVGNGTGKTPAEEQIMMSVLRNFMDRRNGRPALIR
jgi:hypothetical protein